MSKDLVQKAGNKASPDSAPSPWVLIWTAVSAIAGVGAAIFTIFPAFGVDFRSVPAVLLVGIGAGALGAGASAIITSALLNGPVVQAAAGRRIRPVAVVCLLAGLSVLAIGVGKTGTSGVKGVIGVSASAPSPSPSMTPLIANAQSASATPSPAASTATPPVGQQYLEDLATDPKVVRGQITVAGRTFTHGLAIANPNGSSVGWIAVGDYKQLIAIIIAEQEQYTFRVEMDGGIVVWERVISPGQGPFDLDCDLTGHTNIRLYSQPANPFGTHVGRAVWGDAQMTAGKAKVPRSCDPPTSH